MLKSEDDLTWMLKESLEGTAEWRRRVALEYPDDERNVKAAKALERLATTVEQVDPKLLAVFGEELDDADDWFQNQELLSEMLRQIGFHTDYVDAADFVQDFIDKALREAVA
jgi:hypothetical protein